MHEFIGFTITGLVTASIYAIVACGLTLTSTTTGIFNWAHGAFAAIGAFVYWQLTEGWGWPRPLSLVLCVAVLGPAIGLVVEAGIMRRLEGTSEITRMAVTLALLVGIVAAINQVWDPQQTRVVTPLLDGRAVTLAGQRLPLYDLIVMGSALAVGVVLRWVLYRSRAGVQMRAVVDDRTLVVLNGVSPVRTAQLAWSIGASTAVLAGVLIAPKTSMAASALSLLIMNAFAAAVVGRLRSLPLTIVGAVVLGLATGYAQGYIGSRDSLPASQYLIGMVNIVPAIVLFVALQFLPQERLRAAKGSQVREVSAAPTWRGSALLALAVVAGTALVAPLLGPGDLNAVTKVWGIALVAVSLVPLLGWAGRLSVCPLAFASIGAILSAHLTPGGAAWGIVVGGLGAAVVGALLSLTAVRLSPLYLALATAAFAVALDNWVFKVPPFMLVLRIPFTDVTLYRHRIDVFQQGTLTVRRPHLFGLDLTGDHAFFVFGAVVFAIVVLALTALRRSDLGLRMLALKDSPLGYATVGLDRRATTVAAFAISAGIAGVGGAVLGAALQRPGAATFGFFSGVSVLVVVVVMGVASLGSAIGAGLFLGAPVLTNLFPSLSQIAPALTATAGVGLGNNPNGAITSDLRPKWQRVLAVRPLAAGAAALSTAAYLGAITGAIDRWTFAVVAAVVAIGLPTAARALVARAGPGVGDAPRPDGLSDAPERLALALPLTSADRAAATSVFDLPLLAAPATDPGADSGLEVVEVGGGGR